MKTAKLLVIASALIAGLTVTSLGLQMLSGPLGLIWIFFNFYIFVICPILVLQGRKKQDEQDRQRNKG